tara:strand:- start:123 stop:1232 length:1110 start_codon:yes stop_codon:yes gene_type:complete
MGLFSIIISSFILNGFKAAITDKIYDFSGHFIVSNYSNGLSFKNSPIDISKGIYLNYKNDEKINSAYPFILSSALVQADKKEIEGVIFKGIQNDFLDNISSHLISINDYYDLEKEVIISSYLSEKLSVNLNDTLILFFPNDPPIFRKLEIGGIYQTGLEEIDNSIIFGDINLCRKIYGWETNLASGLNVFVKNPEKINSYLTSLKKISSYNEYIESTNSRYVQIFDWLSLLDKNVIIFFIIVVFVACFNIVSIILILIMDKTQMIGTLKSFGTKNKIINSIFFRVGLRISIYGMIIGNSLSLVTVFIQDQFKIFKLDKTNYYVDYIPLDIEISSLIFINGLIMLMMLVSIYIPIFFIQRISVINSIKFS